MSYWRNEGSRLGLTWAEIGPDSPEGDADAVVIGTAFDVVLEIVAGEGCEEVSTGATETVGCEGLGFSTRLQVLTS
jgi:hypothetical protein